MTDVVIDEASGTKRTALGTLLIERGLLDQRRLEEALAVADESGKRLGEVLVRLGWASEEDIARALAEQWQLRYFERSSISFDSKALRRMSHEDAERLEALPIKDGDDGLIVAVAEPTEARLLALRELLGDRIDFVVVVKSAIETCLKSALLSRSGGALDPRGGQFASKGDPYAEAEPREVRAARDAFESEDEPEAATTAAVVDEPVDEPETDGEPVADDSTEASFDGLAGLLADARVQLEELRTVVQNTDTTRKRDRREIEALRTELAQRTSELEERNETIRELQQTLQDVASRLGSIGLKT